MTGPSRDDVLHDASNGPGRRLCEWCRQPFSRRARRDARFCGTPCRQASHRFHRGKALRPATTAPIRLAYADPPYLRRARLYAGHPDFGGEVDHEALFRRLSTYDGWALSCSAESLPELLRLPSCPAGVRVAAWVRGERPNSRATMPLNAWEPLIVWGGRPIEPSSRQGRRIDVLVHGVAPRLTDPARVIGAKPAAFIWWMFDTLGALPGDELDDLFPGSGGIGRAWHSYRRPSRDDAS